jgi:hypothetical protein
MNLNKLLLLASLNYCIESFPDLQLCIHQCVFDYFPFGAQTTKQYLHSHLSAMIEIFVDVLQSSVSIFLCLFICSEIY